MERDVPVFPSSVLGVDRIFSEKIERVGKMIFGLMNKIGRRRVGNADCSTT